MNLSSDEIKNYYYRVFVRQPDEKKKSLSSLTYRLAGVLIDNLDFDEAMKLPQRKKLSEILQASNQAILDSLAQLEYVGFIKRTTLETQIVRDEDKMKAIQKLYSGKFKNDLKSKRFNDTFLLNYFYNMTTKEYIYSLFKSIIAADAQLVGTYSYINELPQSDTTIVILRELILKIYNSVSHIENIFAGMNQDEVTEIIQDILNNSKLTLIPNNGSNVPIFVVFVNEKT